jgi:hypothetical protein
MLEQLTELLDEAQKAKANYVSESMSDRRNTLEYDCASSRFHRAMADLRDYIENRY